MKYYKVKQEYDNTKRVVLKNGKKVIDGILVGTELYTPAEKKRILNNDDCFELVEVSKKQIYWFFGARFC